MPDIKHVVVLMLENCSFDFVLGFLKPSYQGKPFEGLTGNEAVPLDPLTGDMTPVGVTKVSTPDIYVTPVDPGHELHDTTLQLYGQTAVPPNMQALNNGFVASYSRQKDKDGNVVGTEVGKRIMRCIDPSLLPVHVALAQNFLVLLSARADVAESVLRARGDLGRPRRDPNQLADSWGGVDPLAIPHAHHLREPHGPGKDVEGLPS